MRVLMASFLLCITPLAMASAPDPVPLSGPRTPGPLSGADRQSVQDTIRHQLDAFQRGNAELAFGLASPGIQSLFGNAQTFMEAVRQNYPQLYRAREAEFRDIVSIKGQPVQRVLVVGPDGLPVIALYPMEQQSDGSWRIDGCMLSRSDERTA